MAEELTVDNEDVVFNELVHETLADVEAAGDAIIIEAHGQPVGAEYFVDLDPDTFDSRVGQAACVQAIGTAVDDSYGTGIMDPN